MGSLGGAVSHTAWSERRVPHGLTPLSRHERPCRARRTSAGQRSELGHVRICQRAVGLTWHRGCRRAALGFIAARLASPPRTVASSIQAEFGQPDEGREVAGGSTDRSQVSTSSGRCWPVSGGLPRPRVQPRRRPDSARIRAGHRRQSAGRAGFSQGRPVGGAVVDRLGRTRGRGLARAVAGLVWSGHGFSFPAGFPAARKGRITEPISYSCDARISARITPSR
jgi:hypothetical protein